MIPMPPVASAPPEHTRHRFLVLDAMRGLAAIAVAVYHAHDLLGHQLFPHGFLAVDFFFFLSGFIIQFAYGPALDRGMSLGTFMKLRLARLYPFYFLTLLPGIVVLLGPHLLYRSWNPYKQLLVEAAIAGLFLIPIKSTLLTAFPFNPAAWSLCQELIANVLHALGLRRRNLRTLVLLAIPLGIADIAVAYHHSSFDYGWANLDPILLIVRALFPYVAGMALHQWWSARPHRQIPALPCALALVALLWLPYPQHLWFELDVAIVVLAFPLLILLAASATISSTSIFHRPAVWLGILSYPLYLIHRPLLLVFRETFHVPYFSHHTPRSIALTALFLGLSIALALLLELLYDRPVRKYLRHRL